MNQSPPRDWYYTRGGEPVGPVDFDALKHLAADFMLMPPVEMVWTEGMDDWAPVAKIEGLREAKRPWTPESGALSGKDEWFYLVGDVKTGPVTLADLKKKVADHSLDPPLKMVWTEGMPRWMPVYEVTQLCEPLPAAKSATTSGQRDWAADEASLRAAAEMRAAAVAREVHTPHTIHSRAETKAHDHAEAKAAEETRLKAEAEAKAREFKLTAARVAAEEEAKLRAQAELDAKAEQQAQALAREQARIQAEADARAAEERAREEAARAQALAEEQARLQAEAEARAAEERAKEEAARAQALAEEQARLQAEAEARAAEERAREEAARAQALAEEQARLHAEAEARAAEERAREEAARAKALAEEQARLQAEAEARATAEAAKIRAIAEEQARLQAEADERAAQEAAARSEEEARSLADEHAKLRAEAEARAAEIALAAAAAHARAEEEARLRAEVEARAAEIARNAEAAHARAEKEMRLRLEAEAKAAEETRLRKQAETRAAEEARLRLEAQAKAIEEARMAVAARVLAEHNARSHAEEAARLKTTAKPAEAPVVPTEPEAPEEPKPGPAPLSQAAPAESLAVAAAPMVLPDPPELPSRSGDPAKRVWHYTSNSNRLGPVTFEELRALAADKALNPRMDMVWKQGMDAWKAAGDVEGLFERSNGPAESPQALAPAAPAGSAKRQETVTQHALDGSWPGVGRRTFLLVSLLFPAVWGGALGAATPFLTKQLGPDLAEKVLPAAMLVPVVILIAAGIQRIANLGMSRWWYLANFIPFVNLWLGFRTFAGPAGYAIHKKLDKAGVVLAVVYWLALLLGIAALAFGVYLLLNAADDPAVQARLQEFLRVAKSKGAAP